MAQITSSRPQDGTTGWAPTADVLLDALKDESNSQDIRVGSLEATVADLRTIVSVLQSQTGPGVTNDWFVRADDPLFNLPTNGTSDATTALNAAITAAQSAGKDLLLPNFPMKIASPLTWNLAKGSLWGAGNLTTIDASAMSPNGSVFWVTGAGATTALQHQAQRNVISGFTLQGPTGASTTTDGFWVNDTSAIDQGAIEHVVIDGFRDALVLGANTWAMDFNKIGIRHYQRHGLYMAAAQANSGESQSFHGVTFYNSGSSAIAAVRASGDLEANFLGCRFDYTTCDVLIEEGVLNFFGCHFENNRSTGAMVQINQGASGGPNYRAMVDFHSTLFLPQETSGSRAMVEILASSGDYVSVNFFGGLFQHRTTNVLFSNNSGSTVTAGKFGTKAVLNASGISAA